VSEILPTAFQLQVKNLLIDYKDVFAWSYKELKGIPREIWEHKIRFMADAQLIKQRYYRMNPNYALKVREDLDKLLDAGFIYPIEITQWLSPLVIVPKKNGKL
jgi:isoprenylcysteine carboxyl methyltransferase (ICMT) family protein YpbQ